jgi:hypothetical protein
MNSREKFATQVAPEILSDLRHLAASEGRQLQALVDEALSDLLEKYKGASLGPTSWLSIKPALKNMGRSIRSWLSERVPHPD